MGEIGVVEFLVLALVLAPPTAIAAGAAVYIIRLARNGPQATLAQAARRRELR